MKFPQRSQLSVHVPDRIWKLFNLPCRHTVHAFARNINGEILIVNDATAVAWDVRAAFFIVYQPNTADHIHKLHLLESVLGTRNLNRWNDNTPLDMIVATLAAFDI